MKWDKWPWICEQGKRPFFIPKTQYFVTEITEMGQRKVSLKMRFARLEILLNVLFWSFLIWAFVFSKGTMDIVGVELIDGKEHKIRVRNPVKEMQAAFGLFMLFLFFYVELYWIHLLKQPKAVKRFVLQSVGLFIGILILYILLTALVFFPEEKSVRGINKLLFMGLFCSTVVVCYGFTKKWMKHERDKSQLELVKNKTELKLLKQQLQPHFLFNTMNNLLAMVDQEQNPKLADSIDTLSNLLRYVVYDTKKEKVAISQEISFIRNFAAIHLLRFEDDEIDFKLEVLGNFDSQLVEPGIFLCYVENAFKHGVQPEESAFIHIRVTISQSDTVIFHIENSLPKIKTTREEGGFGIQANKERLDLVYPNKHRLVFKKKPNFSVTLTIHTHD